MISIKTKYQEDYDNNRMFLVTRDNAWIPMNLLRYIVHLRRMYPIIGQKARRMFIKHIIKQGKCSYWRFDVTYGDFGHDPYNHIGRGMKA